MEAASLEKAYKVTQDIHTTYGLSQVVAAYETRQRTFSLPFGRFIVAVFPFIQGETLHQQDVSEADLATAATLHLDIFGF